MAYCIYLRKSRADEEAEAHGEGETLARHETALMITAGRMDIRITEIYREVLSGESIAGRPVMQRLLSEVEQGIWAGVLVMEVERLARGDTIDQGIVAQAFKFSGTKIITPTKVYDPNNEYDEEYFEFSLFMSRREYKTINRRLQRGRVASVSEGKYVGNIPPYGYKRVKLDRQKGFTLEPAEAEAEVVRLIFDLYTNGSPKEGSYERIGVGKIASRLNALKISARISEHWSPSSVLGILRNPVYIGKIKWSGRPAVKKIVDGEIIVSRPRNKNYIMTEGLHQPIVNTEIWKKAQELLSKNPPTQVDRRKSIKNPLAGLVICGICGKTMQRRPYANGHQAGLICPTVGCKNVSSDLSLMEKKLQELLSVWMKNYKLSFTEQCKANASNSIIDIGAKSVKRLTGELLSLDMQMDSTYDLLERKIYTDEVFLSRIQTISDRKIATQNELHKLQQQIDSEAARQQKKSTPKVADLLSVYRQTENAEQLNRLLKEVIDKIVYTKAAGGRWDPQKRDDFCLDLFMKIPK